MFIAIKGTPEQGAALYGSGAKSHKAARSVSIHALGKLVPDFRDNVIVALPNWRSLLADFAKPDAILEGIANKSGAIRPAREEMHGDDRPYR